MALTAGDRRHGHGTQLLMAGVRCNKVLSEHLGHSSISMAMDTYSHVLPGLQAEVITKLDSVASNPNQALG